MSWTDISYEESVTRLIWEMLPQYVRIKSYTYWDALPAKKREEYVALARHAMCIFNVELHPCMLAKFAEILTPEWFTDYLKACGWKQTLLPKAMPSCSAIRLTRRTDRRTTGS